MKNLLVILLLLLSYLGVSQSEITITINEIDLTSSPGWIELYNDGDKPVDLSHMYFSDSDNKYLKWRIKGVKEIDGNSFLIIYIDSNSTKAHIDAQIDDLQYIYLYQAKGREMNYVTHEKVTFKGKKTLCKYPDGQGMLHKNKRPTPGRANDVRDFMQFIATPTAYIGLSNAAFRQTQYEYKVNPGICTSTGADLNILMWERFRAIFGLSYSDFRYSFSSNSRNEKENYFTTFKVDGKQHTTWVDIKLPLIYNSVRIHDQLYVDFGFLASFKVNEKLTYNQQLSYYNYDNVLISKTETEYDSETVNGIDGANFAFAPLVIRCSYQIKNWELFAQYYLRKDPDQDGAVTGKRNLKYSVTAGVSYNIKFWSLRGL